MAIHKRLHDHGTAIGSMGLIGVHSNGVRLPDAPRFPQEEARAAIFHGFVEDSYSRGPGSPPKDHQQCGIEGRVGENALGRVAPRVVIVKDGPDATQDIRTEHHFERDGGNVGPSLLPHQECR